MDHGVVVRVVSLTSSKKSFGYFVRDEDFASRKKGIEGIIISNNPTLNDVFYVLSVEDNKLMIGIYTADELEVIDESNLSTRVDLLTCLRANRDGSDSE